MKIAVIGNCHAGIITQAVNAALPAEEKLDCRFIVPVESPSESDRLFASSSDHVLMQVTDFAGRSPLPERYGVKPDRIKRFPLVAGNFLYPFAGKSHPKAASTRSPFCPSGHYEAQLSDSMLIKLMAKYPEDPAPAVVERYLSLNYADLTDLDRLYEMNAVKMQRIGAAADLDLWPKIARSFRDYPLFWTNLHPHGDLLRGLCRHALQQLDLGIDDAAIKKAVSVVKEPLGFVHTPVHPSIARHFGIEWATTDYQYRFMPEGSFTARQYWERFVNFEHNDDLHHAIYDVHRNHAVGNALTVLEQQRIKAPGNCDVLINLAIAYWKQGFLPEAMEAVISALEIRPGDTEWTTFVCLLARQSGLPAPKL
jgi:hypothetical protein